MKMTEDKSEHFSLRWDNFHSNLSTSFHTLLQGEELVDVTIAAEGHFVQAHKVVLSVCSPYFKNLFKVNPCKHPIVILKDVGHKELADILEFMYRGEVNVKQEDLTEFLKTAEMLQVKGLTGDETPGEQKERETSPKSTPTESLAGSVSTKIKTSHKSQEKVPISPRPVSPQQNVKAETVSNEEPVQPPPQKRMRQEMPPYKPPQYNQPPRTSSAPYTTNPHTPTPSRNSVSSSSDANRDLEFVEVAKPKSEPVEIDSDIEEVEATFDDGTNFSEFFEGQSSQSFQDFSVAGLPDEQSGALQGMAMLPEGEQGEIKIVRSARGFPQLVHGGYLYAIHKVLSWKNKVHWKCLDHYTACRARIHTMGTVLVVRCAEHNHPPHAHKIAQRKHTMFSLDNDLSILSPYAVTN